MKYVVFLVVLLLVGEIILRSIGFGSMVLFQGDQDYEYIAKPNQDIMRFGNRIIYNEHSMRSKPLTNDKPIVIGFGDSVLNGGTLTDHDSLMTSIVENELPIRFLNVSAGSWGPDNAAAYLRRNGHFNAHTIVLFVSSHDAYDNMEHSNIAGSHKSYPDEQYVSAIIEVIDRYLITMITKRFSDQDDLMINKNGREFNSGFAYFRDYAKSNGVKLIICLHAERYEVNQGSFNDQGKEILKFCYDNNIPVISGLDIKEQPSHYVDKIHLNSAGQRLWANVLIDKLREG